jgi:replicative DNA helicase
VSEPIWDTPEDLFTDDLARAAFLAKFADTMRGAAGRPIAQILDALREFERTERARLAQLEPIAPAANFTADVLADIAARFEHRQETGEDAIGHKTGFPRLDRILGGLDKQRMTVLLAAPGAGKTTLSNQLAAHVAAHGAPVLYVTFENSREDLIGKQIARIAGKSAGDVRRGAIDPAALTQAFATFQAGAGQRLYYIAGDANTTIDTIAAALEQLAPNHPGSYPLVIVDYLQRLARASPASRDDMRVRTGATVEALAGLAIANGAHVWAISSVHRGDAKGGDYSKMGMASAKESGDIEFAADAVLTLAPAQGESLSLNTDPFTLAVVKNRHGEGGRVDLAREKHTMRFAESELRGTPQYAERARSNAAR